MAKLYKITKTQDNEKAEMLIENLEIADSYFGRMKGLLGRNQLLMNQALWLKPGNNTHTFFMKFSIDCVFVNKSNQIVKIYHGIKPFSIKGPVWKAYSFFEFTEGFAEKWNLQPGDQLHVVS